MEPELLRSWQHEWYGGTDLKRMVGTREAFRHPDAMSGEYTECREVLVGISHTRIRLRYPNGTDSRVQYVDRASNELKSLVALWVCDLVPAGVLADRLEEEAPEHQPAADLLRKWERIKQQEVKP